MIYQPGVYSEGPAGSVLQESGPEHYPTGSPSTHHDSTRRVAPRDELNDMEVRNLWEVALETLRDIRSGRWRDPLPEYGEPVQGRIAVYFNRPARPLPLERLIHDIRASGEMLAVASAWFTNEDIAQAIIDSKAHWKIVIVNKADLQREDGAARRLVDRIKEAFGDHPRRQVVVLGSGDFREGVMHHKFVVCDKRVTWLGSYNLTYQAARNYEALVRIDDYSVAAEFWAEALWLVDEADLWKGRRYDAQSSDAFRCTKCGRIWSMDFLGYKDGYEILCKMCAKRD